MQITLWKLFQFRQIMIVFTCHIMQYATIVRPQGSGIIGQPVDFMSGITVHAARFSEPVQLTYGIPSPRWTRPC